MAELLRRSALQVLAQTAAPCAAAALTPCQPAANFILRCRPSALTIAGAVFGVAMPTACRSVTDEKRATLWLGPDEFLLVAPVEESGAIETAFAAGLSGHPHALVDVGHRNIAIDIAGPDAAAVLNAGCPLDLDDTAFPVGACTRTILGKAQIILWRTGRHRFYVGTWRSFGEYVWQFLDEARSPLT
jgi:sarcosine oxidase subunit gamma